MCVHTQSCPTLFDPMDCSPPGSSVHVIFQARILEWVAISSSRGSSQPSLLHLLHWQADSLPLCHLGITLHVYNKILLFLAWHTNRRNLNTNTNTKFSLFRSGRSVRECQIYNSIVQQNVMYRLRDTQCSRNQKGQNTFSRNIYSTVSRPYLQLLHPGFSQPGQKYSQKKSHRKLQKMIQRRLVWPLSKNNMPIHEAVYSFQSQKKKKISKKTSPSVLSTLHTPSYLPGSILLCKVRGEGGPAHGRIRLP